MNKLTMLILLTVTATIGHAQGFLDAGFKGGINSSKISTTLTDYNPQTINNYLFGAFVRINLGHIYIQPEAYYNSKGGEAIKDIDPTIVNSFNLKTIDVPALVGLKIIDQKALNLRIMGGPVFSFATDKSYKGQFTADNIKNNFFGWQYGAGVDFLFLTIDARMEKYASDISQLPEFSSKNGNFVVSLGIKLF